jgi:hypothetical protein
MKRYITTILVILFANVAFSQDFFDALRYSQTNYDGSARSVSMGSAFGALGGDFISASINPAGLGLYRSGEFSITPSFNINNSKSNYLGTSNSYNKYRFNFNNISYVSSIKTGAEAGITGLTFGVGYNRLKNFNSNIGIVGNGAKTSLLNYYTDYADSIGDPSKFDNLNEGLAWDTYLIDVDSDPDVIEGKYYNYLANYNSYKINDANGNYFGNRYELSGTKQHSQKSFIERSGRIDEYLVSMGFNVDHKLYFGASMGLLDLEFNERTTFSEIDDENQDAYFKDYTLTSNINQSGVGVNFKAGIIYRPMKSLRLGVAFHTPNFYTISNSENKRMVANFDSLIGNATDGYDFNYEKRATADTYQFKFESPFKAILSAAYLFGNKGLISFDYEYANYASSKLRPVQSDYSEFSDFYMDKTNVINTIFKQTGNLRVGGELRLTDNFSLRGGFQLLGNPWQKTTSVDNSPIEIANKNDIYRTYSAGFGYRQQNFFIDFAYRLCQIQEAYQVHEVSASEIKLIKDANDPKITNIADINYLNNQATITFGFRF